MARTHHVEVTRTARVLTLGGGPEPPHEIWYLLHGYGQLAHRFLRRFRSFASERRFLVAPEALSRFYPARRGEGPARRSIPGASWMTREDREREISDYVAYLDTVAELAEAGRLPSQDTSEATWPAVGRPQVRTVVGFSQGVHTATRWAVLGRLSFQRLILWGAALPPDLPESAPDRLRGAELILVRGVEDEIRRLEEEEREEAWLERQGLPFRVATHPGGHEIDRSLLERLVAGPAERPSELDEHPE